MSVFIKYFRRSSPLALLMFPLQAFFARDILAADPNPVPAASASLPAVGGMCDGQSPATDRELRDALAVMREIIKLGPELAPADEETIVRGRGLSSSRLNCLMGKVMAGNDVFGWGSDAAYGVSLSDEERALVLKYHNESQGLKQYLEEDLNITVED